MTSEQEPQEERRESSDEERQAARRRAYAQLGDGLMIRASQYIGTFDMEDLSPGMIGEWARLAAELHARSNAEEMADHRKRYLESIARVVE